MNQLKQPISGISYQGQVSSPHGVPVPSLSQVRREKGLSQDELARLAGVSANTIVRLERGANARYNTLGKLATALGISRRRLIKRVKN